MGRRVPPSAKRAASLPRSASLAQMIEAREYRLVLRRQVDDRVAVGIGRDAHVLQLVSRDGRVEADPRSERAPRGVERTEQGRSRSLLTGVAHVVARDGDAKLGPERRYGPR